MTIPAAHLCILDRQKKPLFRSDEDENLQACPACGFAVVLPVSKLPEEFFRKWPESIPTFESSYPYCRQCQTNMIPSSIGWSDSAAGEYSRGVCFVCSSNENHVVSAYDIQVSREEFTATIQNATRNAIAQVLAGALDTSAKEVRADKARIVSIEEDGTRVIDLTALSDDSRAAIVSECRWFESQGIIHDFQETDSGIIFRPDPNLVAALLATQQSGSSFQRN